jgi:uncharacterized protein
LSQNQIKEILTKCKTIAVVGLSNEVERDSYRVSAYMQNNGYKIIPVNPTISQVLGEKSYSNLLEIPPEIQKNIEIVDIFRKPQDVLPIVNQAVELKAKFGVPLVVWMQFGIVNEQAAKVAAQAGLLVVMDRCLMVEHRKNFK